MKKNISMLSMAYLLFLILLFLSGAISSILSDVVYYVAFILPIVLVLYATRNDERKNTNLLAITKESTKMVLPLVAPTILVIATLSFLTSLVIYIISGKTNSVDLGDNYVVALFYHALLPAIFEELLFRYLPMRLLADKSKKAAILVSATFFSLVHHDLFSIPYAFFAGVVFMAVDIMTDSIIPSVIIHFINNALSVGIIVFSDNPALAPTVYVIIGILSFVSLLAVFKNRAEYKRIAAELLKPGEPMPFSVEMLAFAALTLGIAVINLI